MTLEAADKNIFIFELEKVFFKVANYFEFKSLEENTDHWVRTF